MEREILDYNENNFAICNENKLSSESSVSDTVNKFMDKGFEVTEAIKMTLILSGSKDYTEAQDRFLNEFEGDFTILFKVIDILENYY